MTSFGWSYPPGAANDPSAPYNQEEGPCAMCGQAEDQCICGECPHCGSVGDPYCYAEHGMQRSAEQVAARAAAEREWSEQARAEAQAEQEWNDCPYCRGTGELDHPCRACGGTGKIGDRSRES